MSLLRFLETLCEDPSFRSLTYFERGVWLELLRHMRGGWVGQLSNGLLPDNDKYLSRTLGIPVLVWRKVRKKLLEKGLLRCRDRWLYSPRLLLEQQRASEISKIASKNARARWSRRNGRSQQETARDGCNPSDEKTRSVRSASKTETHYLEDF